MPLPQKSCPEQSQRSVLTAPHASSLPTDIRTTAQRPCRHHERTMNHPGTIGVEQLSPKITRITFANPPVNLIIPETVSRLHDVVSELSDAPDVQVVVFSSGVSDYFFNHFDLGHASEFPMLPGGDSMPTWVDLVVRLSKAPFISMASIRGRTRGGGNELTLACDLR